MIIKRFVHPFSKEIMEKDQEGNLYLKGKKSQILYKNYDGCYDFVSSRMDLKNERQHYDKEYSGGRARKITVNMLKSSWFDETVPWYTTLLASLGNLNGKIVLLLGNGGSYKEIYFLKCGAEGIVFTDLSIQAVKRMKTEFMLSEIYQKGNNAIEFHAVDAMNLPFPDRTFDIIYGAAFVHHLDDMDRFLSEVSRCLKPSGICRFFDQADSPLWNGLKRTIFRPIQLYSYWKQPRSPEDLKAGGRNIFNERNLYSLMKKYHFKKTVFVKEWFCLSISLRHYGKFVLWKPEAMQRARPLFLLMKKIDLLLSKSRFMKKNTLMLVWGFDK